MNIDQLPKHVAIIMDGNGRWAKQKQLPRTSGHAEGVLRVEEAVAFARKQGIEVLTVFAFSTENWSRPQEEISILMRLFINALSRKAKDLRANAIRIRFIGRREGVPREVLNAMDEAMALTGPESAMTLNVAFNYGSRFEITDAFKRMHKDIEQGELLLNAVDENTISQYLYTQGQPDVDLLIRTSGEQRISNFLLWQISYAELYFTPKFWPEFNSEQFQLALDAFAARVRRYGGVKV